ncbi:CRISPR-associated protein Cas8c/Csd1, subtype I-C/DVULG [Singulisphaera sp. GP187]|uniref:type I-C CRISPR-associated protein Cas8c/Csd1 n=1 Tax=Singulisphaera sp. GP187 TaxID=1882752 RepID=UPI00092B1460|nr:type I-C CRISPR-associated protein Cas8c/Csd1 [Singulisphaera sp. GP187]SIO46569.1 CRISPR-associated protein Cas8c/Csd1, subtype I-C/DVULG [Singulisphaera sp. GP187]
MILQALFQHAVEARLVEEMEAKERLVHLVLTIRPDGSIAEGSPWQLLTRTIVDPKKKEAQKEEPGRPLWMPEFPGVNSGGKANFLAEACDKVLGCNGKTGEPIADDGQNASKAFLHFWQRIADAHKATADPSLTALLAFRDRYLATPEGRVALKSIADLRPFGKDDRPTFCAITATQDIPLDKKTITFKVGVTSGPMFEKGSPLHDYWKGEFNRERFADAPESSANNRGVCLVTGLENQQIAEVHRTLIKGVPGLPPIGGYLVSFDTSTPSLSSYGFERGWNAPVSEQAAAAYALGLNEILADKVCRRRFGNAVLCSWIQSEPEISEAFSLLLDTPAQDAVKTFFDAFEGQGSFHHALDTRQFRSLTLAANGGRIVVRRWLDEPLRAAVAALKRWFTDLDIEPIEVPRKVVGVANGGGRKGKNQARAATDDVEPIGESTGTGPLPLSIYALAATTARVASEVQSTVYDALYRAALEEANPVSLLPPLLQRLRIAAAQSGNAIRFQTSRFALLKLILIRSEKQPMLERQLIETNDPAYNCGRLLAILDDIQYAAQGDVVADVVARFYGNASTFPRNVFPRLLRLEKHHSSKLRKDHKKRYIGKALSVKLNDVTALFPPVSFGGPPDFPGTLSLQEQGRFALGFHQQKAKDDRDIKEYLARKAAGDTSPDLDATDEFLADSASE